MKSGGETMKWIRRALLAMVVLLGFIVGAALFTALRSEHPVGFQVTQATAADGHPFAMGVWYPTQASTRPTTLLGPMLMDVAPGGAIAGNHLPLVVISHGNGAGIPAHADLAMVLASAGYVVAAPMHSGDNFVDQSRLGSASLFSGRTKELQSTVDYLLKTWSGHTSIDPQRIGAFGFSAGGFTVLAAIGAQPDLRRVASHCKDSFEFVCDVLGSVKSPLLKSDTASAGEAFSVDTRIKAAVVAAPGLGFTFGTDAFSNVQAPIQLWSGEQDDKVPYATNAKPVREALGERVDFHSVPGAGHTSFLAPCGLLRPPEICADPASFDRKAFHADMNTRVLAYFDKHLKKP
jgi:predicted dienelactone hydrolase